MIDEIQVLEKESKELEPNQDIRKDLIDQAWEYTEKFLSRLESIKAYNGDYDGLRAWESTSIGEQKRSLGELLLFLKNHVDEIGVTPSGPGHLGYIPGGGIYTSAIADYMAAVVNKFAGLFYGGPGAVKMENKLIRWTADLIGYPKESLGNITTGGSIANLIAVTTARDYLAIDPGKISSAVVYYTQQTHHCVDKAIRIAGLAHCVKRQVDLDQLYRMDPVSLRRQVEQDKTSGLIPFFVAASSGSTDTGAADPLDDIADICAAENIWLHVDAAYGGFFILVDELKPLFKGISRADSVVLDPHKSLFLPYGIGIALVRNGKALFDSHHYTANYLQDAYDGREDISPCDLSPELTKHFRGLRMWLPLELHGIAPFRAALKEKWLLTRYFHREVQKLGFEVGPEPDLSVCIYRYIPDGQDANTFNAQLVKAIQDDGRIFVSSTNINGIFWIRIAIVCFRTHLKHINLYLEILREQVMQLEDCKTPRKESIYPNP